MEVLYALESIRTPVLDTVLGFLTGLGGETVFMIIAVTVFWCVDKNCGYYILTTGFIGTVLNQFLKITFRIPRPWVMDEGFAIVERARLGAAGYSFPSGHTQNAFAAFGTLARRTESGVRRGIYCAAIVIVAFSRMYLGVHTPLDVGVSFVLGLILVFALYPVFRRAEKRPEIMYGVLAVMLALALGYLLYTQMWPFPGDTDAENLVSARKNGFTIFGAVSAMLLAFHLDRRYLRFPTDACLPAQIVKVVAGLGIMLVLRTGLKAPLLALLGTEGAANAVRYFIVVVFAAAVWPITFRWFRGWGKGRGEAGER